MFTVMQLSKAVVKDSLPPAEAILSGRFSPAAARVYCDHSDIAQRPVERGAHLDFFKAVTDGALERVEEFAAGEPALVNDCTGTGSTPLGLASFFGHLEIVRFLLGQGAPVNHPSRNFTRETPLHCSVLRSHIEVAGLLLEHGADVNARQVGDFTPLHVAAQNGDVEMMKLLLAHHADVNARHTEGGTALSIANDWGHQEMANLLWQHGGTAGQSLQT